MLSFVKNTKNIEEYSVIIMSIAAILCFLLASLPIDMAFGQDTTNTGGDGADGISNVLCAIVQKLTGSFGKAIATIAIVAIGMGVFFGKLSWPMALATAIGVGLIFGAPQIVNWIGAAGAQGGNTGFSTAGC